MKKKRKRDTIAKEKRLKEIADLRTQEALAGEDEAKIQELKDAIAKKEAEETARDKGEWNEPEEKQAPPEPAQPVEDEDAAEREREARRKARNANRRRPQRIEDEG